MNYGLETKRIKSNLRMLAKAEIDYLLSRVARFDKRANLTPQASAAE